MYRERHNEDIDRNTVRKYVQMLSEINKQVRAKRTFLFNDINGSGICQ